MSQSQSIFHKRRFLILTSDAGFGHRSAAKSIAKALELRHPLESSAVIINPIFEEPVPRLLLKTELTYDRTVTSNPSFYRFTYEISDSRAASALVEGTIILALYKNMKQLIQKVRPDAVLNTNQMFNAPAWAVLSSLAHRPPLYTVVTDLADVHSLWFNPNPDRFFVASDWVKSKAVAKGIPPQKIFISGIPVDPAFASGPPAKADMRRKMGLNPQLTTILVVGSRRVSRVLDHLEALDSVPYPFQVVLIAGGDHDLYNQAVHQSWKFPVQVKNYVNNMAEWMRCADVLVTKAGGLILSEGLAAGLPILLIDYLPGQEEGNVRFILTHQAGAIARDPGELRSLVEAWLQNGQALLKEAALNSSRAGRPDAALVIADALWQASEAKIPKSALQMRLWSHFS